MKALGFAVAVCVASALAACQFVSGVDDDKAATGDSGRDAVARDASREAASSTGHDATGDVAHDTGRDATGDVAHDTGHDAFVAETGRDARHDVATDAGRDAGRDAGDAEQYTEAGQDAGLCAPQQTRCSGNGVQTCNGSGQWGTAVACGASLTCVSGACKGVCGPDQTQCSGASVETCDGTGNWGAPVACSGSTPVCLTGQCVECSPLATQCSGYAEMQTCDSYGAWGAATACPTGNTCILGSCTGICVPTDQQCVGNSVQTCNASGQWANSQDCSPGMTCLNSACTGVCGPSQTLCSGNGVETCNSSGQWGGAVPCSASLTCVGGVCSGVCGPSQTQCLGNGVETCDGTGSWGSPVACAGATPACLDGVCVACNPGATQCSGQQPQTCDNTGTWVPTGSACTVGSCLNGICPPFSLTYSPSTLTYDKYVTITSESPTVSGGTVAAYSVSPPLPTGLTVDPVTGILSGTPTVSAAQTPYTVTATNAAGFTTASLTITVASVPILGVMTQGAWWATSVSWDHDEPVPPSSVLLVFVNVMDGNAQAVSVYANTVQMTALTGSTLAGSVFWMPDPSTTETIFVQATGSAIGTPNIEAIAYTVGNVDQSEPTYFSNSGDGVLATLTYDTTAGSLVCDALWWDNGGTPVPEPTPGTNQTFGLESAYGNGGLVSSTEPGLAGTTQAAWSLGDRNWVEFGTVLTPLP